MYRNTVNGKYIFSSQALLSLHFNLNSLIHFNNDPFSQEKDNDAAETKLRHFISYDNGPQTLTAIFKQ